MARSVRQTHTCAFTPGHQTPTPPMRSGGLVAKDTSGRVRAVVGCGSPGHYVMHTPHSRPAREREDVMVWFPVHLRWSSCWRYSAISSNRRRNEGMWRRQLLLIPAGFCRFTREAAPSGRKYLRLMTIKCASTGALAAVAVALDSSIGVSDCRCLFVFIIVVVIILIWLHPRTCFPCIRIWSEKQQVHRVSL